MATQAYLRRRRATGALTDPGVTTTGTTPWRQCAGNQDHRGVIKIVCRGSGKPSSCLDAVTAASAADADATP